MRKISLQFCIKRTLFVLSPSVVLQNPVCVSRGAAFVRRRRIFDFVASGGLSQNHLPSVYKKNSRNNQRIMTNQFCVLLCALLSLCSCGNQTCEGFELSYLLQDRPTDYCELIEGTLRGDPEATKKLSLSPVDGEGSYELGILLVKIISRVGEKQYVSSLSGISHDEKSGIMSRLRAGIEYGRFDVEYISLEKDFPLVFSFLEGNGE